MSAAKVKMADYLDLQGKLEPPTLIINLYMHLISFLDTRFYSVGV